MRAKHDIQSLWNTADAIQEEAYTNTISSQETINISNKQPNLTLEKKNSKTSRWQMEKNF